MTVQEQIAVLRNWQESDCLGAECIDRRCEAADTMEKLLAVYEAAKDFSDQYELVIKSDEYKGIWTFLCVHNNDYKGPIFRDPSKLRDALKALE